MTDLAGLAAKIHLEETADDLQVLVRDATRRVVEVTAAFALAGLALLFAIELLRNRSYWSSYGRTEPKTKRPTLHYLITSGAVDAPNLFVVSTAMLAVVAAINIGVAVMPKSTNVLNLDKTSIETRARAIVWNRSLGYASYLASLVSMFVAVAEWISGRLPDVWMSAVLLTVIALIATFVAANVAALADDQAERLMGWRSQTMVKNRIRFGIERQASIWKADWQAQSKLRWKQGVSLIVFLVLFYVANLLVMFAIAIVYLHPHLHDVFLSSEGWRTLLMFAAAYTVFGTYSVGGMTLLHRAAFSSRIRNGDYDNSIPMTGVHDSLRRYRRWFYRSALALLDCGLITVVIVAGVKSHELPIGFLLAAVWVLIPQMLLGLAWRRGWGPFSYFLARAMCARHKESARIDSQVSEWEAKLVNANERSARLLS